MWRISCCRMISISLRQTSACCSSTSIRSFNLPKNFGVRNLNFSSNSRFFATEHQIRHCFSGETRWTLMNFSLRRYQTNRFSNSFLNSCSTNFQCISRRFVRNGHPERSGQVNSQTQVRTRTHSSRANGSSNSSKKSGANGNNLAAEQEDLAKMTLLQRFRHMWKKYWYVLVPVHVVTSVMWIGSFYYASISGVDIAGWLEWTGFIPDSWIEKIRNSPKTGHVAIAYLIYKIFSPARYTATLTITHYAIKFLSKRGYIKPIPSRAQMQMILNERRSKYSRKWIKFRKISDQRIEDVKKKIGEKTRKK